ncbi:MAG TPA: hypothetical protein VFT72_04585 [Opitutaceae bacterium]|nr:hypothetical protein [Opitutaceae bacterium]
MNLSTLDIVVVAVPLVAVIAVSIFLRRYMRSVADFLAASRCAGRYLISTALAETGSSVMLMITALEVFSKTGFSLNFWSTARDIFYFAMSIFGLIVFRFRETRALTFHQFFELRYSRGVRVLSSFLAVFSGILNFGIQPAVGARFFVYFCGLPNHVTLGSMTLPTYAAVMAVLMAISLYFALSGGQISVMVTDAIEGVISAFFYLAIAAFILCTISVSEMREALTSNGPGKSFLDPFDIGNRTDFNGTYILLSMILSAYYYRGTAWQQGFAAAAKSAHEGRMAQILGTWRGYSYAAMAVLISLAAFTVLHHTDFQAQRLAVQHGLATIDNAQLQTQMQMPMALGVYLAPGIKGCLLAILLFGLLAAQGVQLHGHGSTILQDVVMPLRKKPFAPDQHVRWLRRTVFGVAAFAFVFSILFKPVDYLAMIVSLLGAIYLSGIGLVVWGGLYWKRGTNAGAWTALTVGATLGISFNLMQQFWPALDRFLVHALPSGPIASYLARFPERCPFNGVILSAFTALIAGTGYVVVSLLTCREPFNLEKMLHRGKYRLEEDVRPETPVRRSWLTRLLDIDHHFTRSDKALTIGVAVWAVLLNVTALAVLAWTLCVGRLSEDWWFHYAMVTSVWISLGMAVITTVWFTIGVGRDLTQLFRQLETVRRNAVDDGMVTSGNSASETDDKTRTSAASS